ncbi:MAG: hypothetical protein ACI8QG_002661 [Flavobacteriales bacterium]|jgi:hypothetical protein
MGVCGWPAKSVSIADDKNQSTIFVDRLVLKVSDGKLLVERCLVVESCLNIFFKLVTLEKNTQPVDSILIIPLILESGHRHKRTKNFVEDSNIFISQYPSVSYLTRHPDIRVTKQWRV